MIVMRTAVVLLIVELMTVSRASATCNCNNGNVDIATPQCACSCYSGFLLPRCLYTADSNVTVEIWMQQPPTTFFSDELLQSLAWGLSISNVAHLEFLYAHPHAAFNKTAAFVQMKGDRAQQLIWDVHSHNSWVAAANIESAWERLPDLPTSTTYGATLTVYRSTDGKIFITIEGILWLIAACVMFSAMSVFESCWMFNTEENVFDIMVNNHPALTDLVDGSLVPGGALDSEPRNPLAHRSEKSQAYGGRTDDDPRKVFTERTRR